MAKAGAKDDTHLCPDACTSKSWLYAESKRILLRKWKLELPSAKASLSYPKSFKCLKWAETRALFRVFCNRTPSDPLPNKDQEPCICGQDFISGRHLLTACSKFQRTRDKLLKSLSGNIELESFILDPKNVRDIVDFLKATAIGYSSKLRPDGVAPGKCSPEPESGIFDLPEMGDFE
jgi:hypothetical protein